MTGTPPPVGKRTLLGGRPVSIFDEIRTRSARRGRQQTTRDMVDATFTLSP
jgi:hypothetical protein